MSTQVLRYKLIVGGATVSGDLANANVRNSMNELPVADFTLANTGGKYTGDPPVIEIGDSVLFSASVDGTTYVGLHTGNVIARGSSVGADGRAVVTFQSRRTTLDHKYLDFNNSVISDVDFRFAFQGTQTASSKMGTWSNDVAFNYPNGILHDSGLAYWGVQDIYPSLSDVPRYVFRTKNVQTAIADLCRIYGYDWHIVLTEDGPWDYLRVDNHNAPYSSSGVTISYGKEINADSLVVNGREKVNGVVLIGSNRIYYRTGSAPYAHVSDEAVADYDIARERAKRWLDTHTGSIVSGDVTLPADVRDVLGKRVVVDDPQRGWTAVGNVVAVDHSIGEDRWTTRWTFDDIPTDDVKLYADVVKEIQDEQQRTDTLFGYEGFHFLNAGEMTWTSSLGAEYSLSSVGFAGTAGFDMYVPIDVRAHPLYTAYASSPPDSYGKTFSNGDLIRYIYLFESPNGAPGTFTSSRGMSRPTTSDWSTVSDYRVNIGGHVLGIQGITVDGWSLPASRAEARVLKYTGGQPPAGTSSEWASNQCIVLSNSDLSSMSWDAWSKSEGYYRFQTVSDGKRPALRMTWPAQIDSDALWNVDAITWCVVGRASSSGSGGWSTQVRLGGFVGTASDWTLLGYGNPVGAGWGVLTGTWTGSGGSGLIPRQFIQDGSIALTLEAAETPMAGTTYSLDVAFFEVGLRTGKDASRIEAGALIDEHRLETKHPIKALLGVYSKSDGTGEDLRYKRVRRTTPVSYVFWEEQREYFLSPRTETPPAWHGSWMMTTRDGKGILTPGWPSFKDLQGAWYPSVEAFYVKYVPVQDDLRVSFDTTGWNIERSPNLPDNTGSYNTDDYLRWNVGSSSADRTQQNKPAWGLTYHILYTQAGAWRAKKDFGTDWGLDFTRGKSLTLVVDVSQ
jgi:hypothetical protein